ncbi:hypothetical protein HHI36_004693 [Cryptolaemus montrouzieri]
MPRTTPQTAYLAIADEVAEGADQNNKLLPLPASTERKHSAVPLNQNILGECNKPNSFRIPDVPKHEESKKRKFSESSLAQHLLGPSKISKIQQIYRQKTKSKTKEQLANIKSDLEQQELLLNKGQYPLVTQKLPQTLKIPVSTPITTVSSNGSKINLLQNINLQNSLSTVSDDQPDTVQDHYIVQKLNEQNYATPQTTNLSENSTNRLKFLTKSNNNIMFKSLTTSAGTNTNSDLQKTFKMCPSGRTVMKSVPTTGQKLIVVSNAQTVSSGSILQRTLTIPFVKNISVKNFDKFKIVTTTATPITLATSVVNTNNFNSVKHKVVTVRTNNTVNTGKKAFPLNQLQMLNRGSIKVLPLGGKILGKTSTSTTPSSMYFMNTMGNMQTSTKSINSLPLVSARKVAESIEEAQGTLSQNMELSGPESKINEKQKEDPHTFPNIFAKGNLVPVVEDYDAKIDEFHIQTVPMNSQETVVEVQCESEIRTDEIIQNMEMDRRGLVCLPEIECFISEAEIIDTSEKMLITDNPVNISHERQEMNIDVCEDKNDQQIDLSENKQD